MAPRVVHEAAGRYTPAADAPAPCRGCGAALAGPFCAECGQRDAPANPTLRELVVELVESLLSVDGRTATTFRALARRPGELTAEYLRGRRAPYLSPLRLYLTCSVLYFAVAAAAPEPVRTIAARTGSAEVQLELPMTGADRRAVNARIDALRRSPGRVRRFAGEQARKAMADPGALKRRYDGAMPKLMFLLVPAFAALSAALFRGRVRYPAHLVFALHVHAATFLAMIALELAEGADRLPAIVVASVAVWAGALAYLALAVRRVFALRLGRAIAAACALAVTYWVVLSAMRVAALAVVIALL